MASEPKEGKFTEAIDWLSWLGWGLTSMCAIAWIIFEVK
jgi:hypothetical protein